MRYITNTTGAMFGMGAQGQGFKYGIPPGNAPVKPATLSLPSVDTLTTVGGVPHVTTDTSGGTLYVAWGLAGITPTAAQIIAGTGGGIIAGEQIVPAAGVNTFPAITGLGANTNYVAWFVQVTGAGNSNLVNANFKTAAAAAVLSNALVPAPSITIQGGTPQVNTNTAGGTLYLAWAPFGSTPSQAQIIAAAGGGIIAGANLVPANGTNIFPAITGLNLNTQYSVFFVQVTGAGNSNTASVFFTTNAGVLPDGATSFSANGVTSASWLHTPTPSTTPSGAAVGMYGFSGIGVVTGITYGPDAMFQAVRTTDATPDECLIYGKLAPAAGAQIVNMTFSGAAFPTTVSFTVTGGNNATLFSNTSLNSGNGSALSTIIAGAVGELAMQICGTDGGGGTTLIVGGGATEIMNQSNGGETAASSYNAGAVSQTMSYTMGITANWAMVAVSFKAQ